MPRHSPFRKTIVTGLVALVMIFAAYIEFSRFTFGIECPDTLFVHSSLSKKLELKYLVTKTLYFDGARELKQLTTIDCGGGAGCYYLGYILLQLLDRLGDDQFASLLQRAEFDKQSLPLGLLRVGAEYGDPKGIRTVQLDQHEGSRFDDWGFKYFPKTLSYLKRSD